MAEHSDCVRARCPSTRPAEGAALLTQPSSPARTSTASRTSGRRRSARQDAIQLLRADRRRVQGLFDQFEKARGEDRKAELAQAICAELKVHAQIEEEIFYPAAREALKQEDLIDEAAVEHASAKGLIAQIEHSESGNDLFDAKVTVLGEYIKHHVKEEQNEMCPKLRKTKLDLKSLGQQLAERKEALLAEA